MMLGFNVVLYLHAAVRELPTNAAGNLKPSDEDFVQPDATPVKLLNLTSRRCFHSARFTARELPRSVMSWLVARRASLQARGGGNKLVGKPRPRRQWLVSSLYVGAERPPSSGRRRGAEKNRGKTRDAGDRARGTRR
ncbi:hypothetical protein PSPO01_03320 [Paraphaeosphaeria sporulosa]